MNAIEGTVLLEALIALRNDELEPHDTLECLGWRPSCQLQRVFMPSIDENGVCEALHAQGLLERKDDLYRITDKGVAAALSYTRDPARYREARQEVSEGERLRQLRAACEPLKSYVKPEVEWVNIPAALVRVIMELCREA